MSNVSVSAKVVKNKLGLLELAKTLGNVSQACKIMGYSRESCQAASESNPFPALKSTPLVMLFSSVSLAPFSRNNRKRSFLKR